MGTSTGEAYVQVCVGMWVIFRLWVGVGWGGVGGMCGPNICAVLS